MPGTVANKEFLIEQKITPVFGKIPLNDIKPFDIRKWQNELTSYRDEKGNPCHKAGGMEKKNVEEMEFWTKDEFNIFFKYFEDKPEYYTMFHNTYQILITADKNTTKQRKKWAEIKGFQPN